jgi:hypothetical protein
MSSYPESGPVPSGLVDSRHVGPSAIVRTIYKGSDMEIRAVLAGPLFLVASLGQTLADPLPTQIGQCSRSTISTIGTRLEGEAGAPVPDSGSAIGFANGGGQVSYETVLPIARSRLGDPVSICLVSIPRGCPPGDNRGRIYQTTNLRTRQSWRLPDSQHSCGGA